MATPQKEAGLGVPLFTVVSDAINRNDNAISNARNAFSTTTGGSEEWISVGETLATAMAVNSSMTLKQKQLISQQLGYMHHDDDHIGAEMDSEHEAALRTFTDALGDFTKEVQTARSTGNPKDIREAVDTAHRFADMFHHMHTDDEDAFDPRVAEKMSHADRLTYESQIPIASLRGATKGLYKRTKKVVKPLAKGVKRLTKPIKKVVKKVVSGAKKGFCVSDVRKSAIGPKRYRCSAGGFANSRIGQLYALRQRPAAMRSHDLYWLVMPGLQANEEFSTLVAESRNVSMTMAGEIRFTNTALERHRFSSHPNISGEAFFGTPREWAPFMVTADGGNYPDAVNEDWEDMFSGTAALSGNRNFPLMYYDSTENIKERRGNVNTYGRRQQAAVASSSSSTPPPPIARDEDVQYIVTDEEGNPLEDGTSYIDPESGQTVVVRQPAVYMQSQFIGQGDEDGPGTSEEYTEEVPFEATSQADIEGKFQTNISSVGNIVTPAARGSEQASENAYRNFTNYIQRDKPKGVVWMFNFKDNLSSSDKMSPMNHKNIMWGRLHEPLMMEFHFFPSVNNQAAGRPISAYINVEVRSRVGGGLTNLGRATSGAMRRRSGRFHARERADIGIHATGEERTPETYRTHYDHEYAVVQENIPRVMDATNIDQLFQYEQVYMCEGYDTTGRYIVQVFMRYLGKLSYETKSRWYKYRILSVRIKKPFKVRKSSMRR